MITNYEIRHNVHPLDARQYSTDRIRKEFLVEKIFSKDEINLVYSYIDRFITGGAMPVNSALELENIEILKSEYFLERRELGIINIGGDGKVSADDKTYKLKLKEALYLGRGNKSVIFESLSKENPAKFYLNSANAHADYPNKLITKADAPVLELGALETSNERKIYQLMIHSVVQTCQLQMGLTELMPGSIWNTMPPHKHSRRNEVYFYFNLAKGQAISHFMGEPNETRHIWMQNEQAILSPSWSIHAGAGTSNYAFIWGMAGENLDYGDMDVIQLSDLR